MTDDALERYEAAKLRLGELRAAWEAAGSPFTMAGNRGGVVEHVLHRLLWFEEMQVDRLAKSVRPARIGRPPSAVPGLPPPLELALDEEVETVKDGEADGDPIEQHHRPDNPRDVDRCDVEGVDHPEPRGHRTTGARSRARRIPRTRDKSALLDADTDRFGRAG